MFQKKRRIDKEPGDQLSHSLKKKKEKKKNKHTG
jgi:hypothetical protein